MKYVIVWGDYGMFDTVPAHTAEAMGRDVHSSKDAAINAAINQLCQQRSVLDHAIKIARKKQQRRDRRANGKDEA